MAKNSRGQRKRTAMLEENTELKQRNKDLEGALFRWKAWYSPISKAINEGNNLRAIALMKSKNAPTTRIITNG